MTDREKEILVAVLTVGYDRVNPDKYPRREVDALIYKALRFMLKASEILIEEPSRKGK